MTTDYKGSVLAKLLPIAAVFAVPVVLGAIFAVSLGFTTPQHALADGCPAGMYNDGYGCVEDSYDDYYGFGGDYDDGFDDYYGIGDYDDSYSGGGYNDDYYDECAYGCYWEEDYYDDGYYDECAYGCYWEEEVYYDECDYYDCYYDECDYYDCSYDECDYYDCYSYDECDYYDCYDYDDCWYDCYDYDDCWYDCYDDDHGCHSNCNPPPHDECSNIPGNQPDGYDCYPTHDECSNIPGNQPDGYDCYPDHDEEPVCALSADDTSIEEGDSTELHWTSENATSATLTTFGSVSTGGNRTVSPTSDKTYTLTVRDNDGDEDTCSVHINVEEEEEDDDLSCDLSVSDTRVDEGDRVTLEWDIDGDADYASINEGIGRVDEDGGEERVTVDEDTTFRLTVRNDDDEDTCSVTVRVDEDNDFSSIEFEGDPVNNPPVVYLSDLPYTGIEDLSPSMIGFFATIAALLGIGGYFVFVRRSKVRA